MKDEKQVKRYRMSYRHGIREDDGTLIWPADASKPMVCASDYEAAMAAERANSAAVVSELHEQCRLLGAGSEREARLMADRDRLRERVAWLEVQLKGRFGPMADRFEDTAALREMSSTVAVKGPLLVQLLDEIDYYRAALARNAGPERDRLQAVVQEKNDALAEAWNDRDRLRERVAELVEALAVLVAANEQRGIDALLDVAAALPGARAALARNAGPEREAPKGGEKPPEAACGMCGGTRWVEEIQDNGMRGSRVVEERCPDCNGPGRAGEGV